MSCTESPSKEKVKPFLLLISSQTDLAKMYSKNRCVAVSKVPPSHIGHSPGTLKLRRSIVSLVSTLSCNNSPSSPSEIMAMTIVTWPEKTESMVEEPRQSSVAKPDTCNALLDSPSYVPSAGDPSSDRRDLDFFNQGLATGSEEYKSLFKLPNDEVLLDDFNCALQENILLQGHMYLFLRHVCFYSNIFGYETKKIIPLNEITAIRKAKTAAIFPNAIEIAAGGKKHFFGSFLSRGKAYRMITDYEMRLQQCFQHAPSRKISRIAQFLFALNVQHYKEY